MILRFQELQAAAQVLDVTLQSHEVREPKDFDQVFKAIQNQRPDALFVISEVLTITHRCRVLDFAATYKLPTIAEFGLFAQDGGLMTYSPKLTETFQRSAIYIDNVFERCATGEPACRTTHEFRVGHPSYNRANARSRCRQNSWSRRSQRISIITIDAQRSSNDSVWEKMYHRLTICRTNAKIPANDRAAWFPCTRCAPPRVAGAGE